MESPATTLTLATILQLGAFTAIATVIASWIQSALTSRGDRTRKASLLAAQTAVMLEAFAISIAQMISQLELHNDSGGHDGTWTNQIPVLGEYPEGDWSLMEPGLFSRALSLRNDLNLAQRAIESFFAMADPADDENDEIVTGNAGICGYRALSLAKDMRHKYNLPVFDPGKISWDLVAFVKGYHDKHAKRLQRQNN